MRKSLWLIPCLVLCMSSLCFALSPQDLTYMTEEYAPYNYSENGKLKGISVDLLKLIWTEMGVPQQNINIYPWARSYKMVQKRPHHVLFAMSLTPERREMFKWVGPIYDVKFVLTGRTDKKISILSPKDLEQYSIGTIREDAAEQLLKTAGITSLQSVPKMELNIRKLLAGRIDLIAHSERGMKKEIEAEGLDPDQFRVWYLIKEVKSYYAFHRKTPDELIQSFQSAFDKLESEGEVERLRKIYLH